MQLQFDQCGQYSTFETPIVPNRVDRKKRTFYAQIHIFFKVWLSPIGARLLSSNSNIKNSYLWYIRINSKLSRAGQYYVLIMFTTKHEINTPRVACNNSLLQQDLQTHSNPRTSPRSPLDHCRSIPSHPRGH